MTAHCLNKWSKPQCVCVCVCVCLCVWTVPFILVVPCSDSSNQQIILLLLLIEAFYFLRIRAHTHTRTHTNGLRREREMDTYIQLDQQINYSEQCDSRCLGGRDSAVVSATTFDQKFKNRPCVANRRLDESLRPGFPSSPTPATIFSSQIFWGHLLRGDTLRRGCRPQPHAVTFFIAPMTSCGSYQGGKYTLLDWHWIMRQAYFTI